MELHEIDSLRKAVAAAKAAGSTILWRNVDGDTYTVSDVPAAKLDPDKTGVKDFIACLNGKGHIDLFNVEATTFLIAASLTLS